VDQLALALVLLGVRLSLALHPLDLRRTQAAGAFDADLLLLARTQILSRDVQDAVGVDVERDLDLRHAAWRRRDILQVELAQEAVARAFRDRAFALEHADRYGRLVVLGRREDLLLDRRDGRVALDEFRQHAAQSFNAERQRR